MSYKIGQYNNSNSQLNVATYITDGEVIEINTSVGNIEFKDYGLQLSRNLSNEENYYFHLRIKRMTSSAQDFSIKLKSSNSDITEEQYIAQNIKVEQGQGWQEVEIVFNPIISSFNIIEVSLARTVSDYSNARIPHFIFEELSLITNLMGGSYLPTNPIIKIGVQAHPGFNMCINGEAIRVGRGGLYEMRNGKVYITFFSPLAPSVDSTIQEYLVENPNKSISLISNTAAKTRTVNKFTVDYIYEEDI